MTAQQTAAQRPTGTSGRAGIIIALVATVVAPLVIFYVSRGLGVSVWVALILGIVPAVAHASYTLAARRRVDRLALLTLTFLVASTLASLIDGDPRFLLAKDGWMTAFVGIAILWTLRGTPFYLLAIRSLTSEATRENVDIAWNQSAQVRHILRVATAIWGIGLIADAVIRLWVAYTLPLDVAPLVNGLQYVVVFVLLELGSQIYLRVAGKSLPL